MCTSSTEASNTNASKPSSLRLSRAHKILSAISLSTMPSCFNIEVWAKLVLISASKRTLSASNDEVYSAASSVIPVLKRPFLILSKKIPS